MEVEKAILGRRSVREYLQKPVPKEALDAILKAGAMAPSAMDEQPCRFIVVDERKRIAEIARMVEKKAGLIGIGARLAERAKVVEDAIFYGAPLLILIAANESEWAEIDCALAAENMMIRAYDLGLGSCFIGFTLLLRDDRQALRAVGLKEKQMLYCALIFGYPKRWPAQKRREAKTQKG